MEAQGDIEGRMGRPEKGRNRWFGWISKPAEVVLGVAVSPHPQKEKEELNIEK